jgi:hypothetical protein
MEHINANVRFALACVIAIVAVLGTAYMQTVIHFSTYIALAICLIAAFIFALLA